MSKSLTPPQLLALQRLYQQAKTRYETKVDVFKEWVKDHQPADFDLKTASQQTLAVLSFAGQVAMNQPVNAHVMEQVQAAEATSLTPLISSITQEEHQAIIDKMVSFVQLPAGHLNTQDELYLEQQLSDILGFEVMAELEGNRLNHSIGIMGGEQHLKRFPTDTLDQHDAYREAGIAPNRGAFGWFTEQAQLTDKAIQREKYYFAVQTLYLPNWNTDHPRLKEWYKFRKMIVINPAEQVAVVGVVGDAGPAKWVQKQYGGSPEIIREGKIWSRESRGRVILLFVNDPEDKIPLGPISLDFAKVIEKQMADQGEEAHE
ncbi:MAG TPA: hypothetical protein VD999_05175 [Vitreimonas sp.]|nr:hypothetical protein [Vitreimonas sp.]